MSRTLIIIGLIVVAVGVIIVSVVVSAILWLFRK